jgi:hypothetical protein
MLEVGLSCSPKQAGEFDPQAFDKLMATIRRAEKRQGASVKTVSTVRHRCHTREYVWKLAGRASSGLVSPQSVPVPTVPTVLTVVGVGFARIALSLMMRVPARPPHDQS